MKLAAVRPISWLLLALSGLLHVAMLIGWRWQLPLVPYFFDATVLSGGRGLDFYAIYQAGSNARRGLDIYEGDPARVPVAVPYFTPYRYLPVVAYTAGVALSMLSPLAAYKLWVVVIELALLACVVGTWRLTRHDLDLFARLAAMWLAFSPYYLELFMGQFSMVQAALVWGLFVVLLSAPSTADALTSPRRRLVLDSLWVMSVLWKITTVLFAPVLARLGRWRPMLAAAGLGLVLTVPYFLVFPAHLGDFVRNNLGGRVAGHELGNLGFRQLVYQALSIADASPAVQQATQMAVVLAVLSVALWATFRPRRIDVIAALSLWLAVFFLASPQVWEHHYVMALPALVGLYLTRRSRWVVVAWLLLALPTPFGFIGLQPTIAANHDLRAFALEPAWQPLAQHASKALPAVVLFVCAAAWTYRGEDFDESNGTRITDHASRPRTGRSYVPKCFP